MDYYMQEVMSRHGLDLSKEQMIVLKKLHDQDGLKQNELASLTYRDKSSLARLLSKMEAKNFIVRKQSEEDKRSNEVFLTDEGRRIFHRTRPAIKEHLETMEQDLTEEEKHHIIQILKKVQFNFTGKTANL
ncbi:MarR family transcriptional regulator [Flavobacteriaceae bacterium TP-CH-4]|uniref:MarR family transcriptional regulator n=2 Tax=Pelagihabitans pacificus TaxID=2696054 RepID=A0A967AS65_9FLAO|nr:MarR family transcriptional regulator [Pelagihabitans pacificus]